MSDAGETVSHVFASVLKTDPDWTTLPATTPVALRRLLRRCLEKDRKRRLDSAADARLEIEEALTSSATTDSPGLPTSDSRLPTRRGALPWAVAGASLLVAVALLIFWPPWRWKRRSIVRWCGWMSIGFGRVVARSNGQSESVSISPDGTRLVYVSGMPTKLFIRRLDQPKATELPGTQGASGRSSRRMGSGWDLFPAPRSKRFPSKVAPWSRLADVTAATADGARTATS